MRRSVAALLILATAQVAFAQDEGAKVDAKLLERVKGALEELVKPNPVQADQQDPKSFARAMAPIGEEKARKAAAAYRACAYVVGKHGSGNVLVSVFSCTSKESAREMVGYQKLVNLKKDEMIKAAAEVDLVGEPAYEDDSPQGSSAGFFMKKTIKPASSQAALKAMVFVFSCGEYCMEVGSINTEMTQVDLKAFAEKLIGEALPATSSE